MIAQVRLQEEECQQGGRHGEEEREELDSGNAMQDHHRHVADECEWTDARTLIRLKLNYTLIS